MPTRYIYLGKEYEDREMKQFNKTFLAKIIENTHKQEIPQRFEHTDLYLLSDNGVISNSLVSLHKVNSLLKRYGKRLEFE